MSASEEGFCYVEFSTGVCRMQNHLCGTDVNSIVLIHYLWPIALRICFLHFCFACQKLHVAFSYDGFKNPFEFAVNILCSV